MNTNEKWEKLYAALNDIRVHYGASVVSEPKRVKNLLLDFVPGIPNEVKAFSNVICEQDINRYISNGTEIQIDYLVSRIEDNMGLSTEWAQKIAKGILVLLGKTAPVSLQNEPKEKKAELPVISQQTSPTIKTPPAVKMPSAVKTLPPVKTSSAVKTLPPVKTPQTTKTPLKNETSKATSHDQQLISGGYSRLSKGLWDKAQESFDGALRISEHPRAYVGKMMATFHIRKVGEIPMVDRDFESDPNWIKAKKIASGSYKDKLLRYEREHRAHLRKITQNKQPVRITTTPKQPLRSKKTTTKSKKKPSGFKIGILVVALLLLLAAVIFFLDEWLAQMFFSF